MATNAQVSDERIIELLIVVGGAFIVAAVTLMYLF